jgi:hypothetical protein
MAEESKSGVSYLLSLKQSSSPGAVTAGLASSDSAAAQTSSPAAQYGGSEKRRSPRYKCAGSAELREPASESRTWATFTDVSMHGCYVEATTTYAVGTILSIKLDAYGIQVLTDGNVRVNYPGLGMGIAFATMGELQRTHLRDLLKAIPRFVIKPSNLVSGDSSNPSNTPAISDPAAAVHVLTEYFKNRQILMRDEFFRLLRKSQR